MIHLFRSVMRSLALFTLFICMTAQAQKAPIQLALIEGMSGPFANTGEAVLRNLVWAVERVNARGGVNTTEGKRLLVLNRYDSKGQNEEALTSLRAAIDAGAQYVFQGNSSANAAVLIDAIQKHNERDLQKRVLFLNYSAVDPALTQDKCNFWHFRFDAHADMRMTALMQVLKQDAKLKSVYLLGQDYSFGQAVLREAKQQLSILRPDIQVAGEELHPMGRVKDFLPYAAKIKASGAQAVITGNWGNDLTLLVKAAKEVGFDGKFYTFYGNALGAPCFASFDVFASFEQQEHVFVRQDHFCADFHTLHARVFAVGVIDIGLETFITAVIAGAINNAHIQTKNRLVRDQGGG